MAKLTTAQKKLVEDIVASGRCVLSRESSSDYLVAAAFVFDNGLLHRFRVLSDTP